MKQKHVSLALALAFIAITGEAFLTFTGAAFAADKTFAGTELLESRCSVCHDSAWAKGAKKNAEQWETTVTRMMGKGAKLSGAEKKTLVSYLAKAYKPLR
jgi:cytochrome c5